jgi:DnaJ-class molecular chaperone
MLKGTKRPCPDCKGTGHCGHLGLPKYTCITCNGSGKLTVYSISFSEVVK